MIQEGFKINITNKIMKSSEEDQRSFIKIMAAYIYNNYTGECKEKGYNSWKELSCNLLSLPDSELEKILKIIERGGTKNEDSICRSRRNGRLLL